MSPSAMHVAHAVLFAIEPLTIAKARGGMQFFKSSRLIFIRNALASQTPSSLPMKKRTKQ